MDSLSDHASQRSTGGRSPDRGTAGTVAAINKVLLLAGALLFINGASITFIAVLIPFAISSAIVITFVTGLTVASAIALVARRRPERTRRLVESMRPIVETVNGRDQARRQGGL